MSTPYRPGPLPQPENRRDNTVGWLLANAAVWTVAAPFAVAYWARGGVRAIRHDIRAMQPHSGPFRDFRRLQFEREREAKLGVPASNELYLPMRLDNDRQRPSQELRRPEMPAMPARMETRSANPGDFRRTEAPRGSSEVVLPRFQEVRVNLRVPFADREEAKGFGARWDGDGKTWYAPPGTDLKQLTRWLPAGVIIAAGAEALAEAPSSAVVPQEIVRARQVSALQQSLQLDEMLLVGAMADDEGELPPVDAYDDLTP